MNAMALLERSQSLVTASSDRTVRCWRADGSGACVGVAREHNDYVMSVGAAASANRFVSAGLKGEVFTWDLATMVATERMPEPEPAAALFHAVSVYAAAMDGAGNIAVTGSTDNVVRVWDARVGGAAKPLKLLGHEDNVRCVAVNAEGTMALSGGSDATIRLWDLRQHRCSQTLAVHSDSVWALAADPRWTSVLSAGRDKRCYRTDLRSRESSPAFESETPIAAMAVEANQASVWVSGPSSSVHKWFLEGGGGRRARSNAFVAGTSPIAHKRMVETAEAKGEVLATPEQLSPAATIEGLPGIVQHQVLADKRHVLTRDSAGQVALWDVVAGEQTRSYDKADFDETFKSIETKDVVTSWFAVDARLGRLAIHLECPQCFRAECYSVDLGLGGEDDVRVCPGDIVLRSLLSRWVDKQRRASGSRRSSKDPAKAKGEAVKPLVDTLAPAASVVTADASGVTWRKAATDLTGAEGVDMFPEWVIDCVLRDTYPVPAGLKCSFRLLPAEGSNLAPIPNPKLTAPRILRIRKVRRSARTLCPFRALHGARARLVSDPALRRAPRSAAGAPAGAQIYRWQAGYERQGAGTSRPRAPRGHVQGPGATARLLARGHPGARLEATRRPRAHVPAPQGVTLRALTGGRGVDGQG